MRIGCIINTLTSVDIQEILKIEGKVIQIYEGVFHRKNFRISSIKKIIGKLLALRQKCKDEINNLMQNFVKLIMNSLSEVHIRKDKNEVYKCKSEHWMQTEYDDKVLDYW